ncbi:PREDICTED: putative gustatory receptor 28b [Dufourea novaeangliae]|uniref:putative gustatory receptor 28b n=1 Tax=Dufourea novaeangliae TaxID=178035 RepID=UPI0007672FDC|nr:PREDICTED: putative gustatory receptor 28b [Dufourea novaeangliae]
MTKTKTFRDTIRPILLLNTMAGMGCFIYAETTRTRKLMGIIYSTCYVLFILYSGRWVSLYLGIYYSTSTVNSESFKTGYYSHMFLSILLIVTVRIRTNKLCTMISLLNTCDQKMETIGMPKQIALYRKQQFLCIVIVTSVVAGNVANCCISQLNTSTPTIVKLMMACGINMPALVVTVSDVSFYFWVKFMEMKFRQLNDLLREMLTIKPCTPTRARVVDMIYDFEKKEFRDEKVLAANGNANTMRAVKQIHLQLIKIARTVNEYFGIQILLTMCTFIFYIITLLFVIYKILANNSFHPDIISLVFALIMYTSKIFLLSDVCNKTTSEVSDTGDLICKLYEPSTSKEFRAEIRDFTLQMIQNPLMFTACGFFDLDNTFIQGVAGTIGTYVVILIQVGQIDLPDPRETNTTMTTTTVTTMA